MSIGDSRRLMVEALIAKNTKVLVPGHNSKGAYCFVDKSTSRLPEFSCLRASAKAEEY